VATNRVTRVTDPDNQSRMTKNGIAIPPNARTAIEGYNHGVGAATAVLEGRRGTDVLHRQSEFPPGMSLPGGFDISPSEMGFGGFQ